MKRKQIFIILGAVGFVFLIFWFIVLALVFKTMRGSNEEADAPVAEVTLCDEDTSDLCIVAFGANKLNRMVINFQFPSENYAPFYVKANNRETVSVYSCEVAESVPTSAYCTGARTPLGETIDIEVYTTDEDKLIARGTFLVSAIALATPISLPENTPSGDETPTSSPTPTRYVTPTEGELTEDVEATPTATPTSTPDTTAYPNP
jgi:hypothetical protein